MATANIDAPLSEDQTSFRPSALSLAAGLVIGFFEWFGSLGIFFWQVMRAAVTLPFEGREFVRQLDEIGSMSLPLVALAGSAIGVTDGLLGNQFVAISFGSPGQADVTNGQTIQSQPPLIMADMLKKASGILDNSQQAVQNATQATEHLKSVTAKIDSGQGTVGELVNDKELYSNLEKTTSTLNITVAHAESGVTDFQENMEALKHNLFLSGYFKKRRYEESSELAANRISGLPDSAPAKTFAFAAKQLFDGRDSAKLKNQKSLKEAGDYLARNQFGVAVIVTSTGMEGDTQKDQTLTEARAMVVREYLVENFSFDDSLVKTLGMGKQTEDPNSSEWGMVKILIFPFGTQVPPSAQPQGATTSSTASEDKPGQPSASPAHKP